MPRANIEHSIKLIDFEQDPIVARYKFLRWKTLLGSDWLIVESVTVVDSLKRVPARRDLIQIKSEALLTLKFVCISFYVCTINFQIVVSLSQSTVIQCQALLP